ATAGLSTRMRRSPKSPASWRFIARSWVRLGKPFPTVLPYAREIYCAKDTRTALEMAGPYLAEKYQTYAKWGQDEVLPGDDTFHQPFEELLRDRFVLGSPDDCYEQPAAVLGADGGQFPDVPHPLERDAARPRF